MKRFLFGLVIIILIGSLFFIIKQFFNRKSLQVEWRSRVLSFTSIHDSESCYKAGGWSSTQWDSSVMFICIVFNKQVCDDNGGKLEQTGDFISCMKQS